MKVAKFIIYTCYLTLIIGNYTKLNFIQFIINKFKNNLLILNYF